MRVSSPTSTSGKTDVATPAVACHEENLSRRGGSAGLPIGPTAQRDWLLAEEGFNRAREHETGSLFTVANGYMGTRGSLAEGAAPSAPATFVAGVFGIQPQPGAIPELIKTPDWTHLSVFVADQPVTMDREGTLEHRRVLDMRQGIVWREWRFRDPQGRVTFLGFARLASLADRHVLLRSATLLAENYSGPVRVESRFPEIVVPGTAPLAPAGSSSPRTPVKFRPAVTTMTAPGTGIRVAIASASRLYGENGLIELPNGESRETPHPLWRFDAELGKSYRLDRIVVIYTSREVSDPAAAAVKHLDRVLEGGGAPAIAEAHRRAWAERWRTSDIEVDGDPEAQLALRFAMYHLISAANPEDERVSVGARALTGESYKGHVFWDTEIFMLPFYIFTHPATARALLMYRYHTLPGAREKARALGYRGALYAWESASDGRETTPATVFGPTGVLIRVLCGEQEQHISADVAYGAWQYWEATGDDEFFRDAGAEILLDTARFWASRVSSGPDGLYHIRHVIGPDEYHESIADDAYTNVLAQWNLERGAEAAALLHQRWPERARELFDRLGVTPAESEQWLDVARKMYTGFDPATGLFEQFRGYFGLEDIDLKAYEPRTAPMDVLLGRERTQQSKVVKQADVVMLLALLWDRFPAEVRKANFHYYEPRTGHGSSLSPAAHAQVAARLGDVATAERYFRQAARIDLADNMGNASGGVHAAALGGLWQAAVLGFGGMTLAPHGLIFDPRLPEAWRRMRFRVQWRGRHLVVTAGHSPRSLAVRLLGGESMDLAVADGPRVSATAGHEYVIDENHNGWGAWQEVQT